MSTVKKHEMCACARLSPFREANDASVKEMEAAGIAHVAAMFGVPFIAVKAITDIVDGDKPTQDEFMENLGRVNQGRNG